DGHCLDRSWAWARAALLGGEGQDQLGPSQSGADELEPRLDAALHGGGGNGVDARRCPRRGGQQEQHEGRGKQAHLSPSLPPRVNCGMNLPLRTIWMSRPLVEGRNLVGSMPSST